MLQLKLAKELGYTLSELTQKMSIHELLIWNAYFALEKEEHDKLVRKTR